MTTPRLDRNSENTNAMDEALQDIETHSQEGGIYLRLLLEGLEVYANDPAYYTNPELAAKCFGPNGVDDDINEIIQHLSHDFAPTQRSKSLLALLESTKDNPVYRYFVEQICDYFDVRLEADTTPHEEKKVIRFYAPNLHFSDADEEMFFRACGLTYEENGGGSSHIRWLDKETGKFCAVSAVGGKKKWLKNTIKDLLALDLPIERIQTACNKLKIDFRILLK